MIAPLVQIALFTVVLAICLHQRIWLGVALSAVWILINITRWVLARRRPANDDES